MTEPYLPSRKLRILYVGTLEQSGTCLQRKSTLEDLGCEIEAINIRPAQVIRVMNSLPYRIWHRFVGPIDLAGANKEIIDFMQRRQFDVLWIDKGRILRPGILRRVKQLQSDCLIAGYSPDDMTGNPRNQSRGFLKNLPYFDIYFTTKTYCVDELKALGCPKTAFVGNAYDKNIHKPIPVTQFDRERFGGPVGFIGKWEQDRAEHLIFLAESGIPVRVWGKTWRRCRAKPPNLILENCSVWKQDYAKAICSFDINLCFLKKANRDLQTTRSIEIPACGGFMLAERTSEHQQLFEEGKEAEFFGSKQEMVEKVKYYLNHADERIRIAQAGRRRCIESGYSNHDRLKEVLSKIEDLRSRSRPSR